MKPFTHLHTRFHFTAFATLSALTLLALALPVQVNAQATPPMPDAAKPASSSSEALVQQWKLANGMTVIVKPDRRAPTAVQMLWVRVGAMDEVDGTSGVAHVLEHMMFKGSSQLKPGEFSRKVAALGGRENAFTSLDVTSFHQQIPAAKLEAVMALEADRFATNQWSDEEFKKELEVVKEERRMRTDDQPRAQVYEQLNAAAYLASPYHRPIIGWMNDLDAMSPDDARAFFKRWYMPANAAVVIAGDVDVDKIKVWAEKYYGSIAAQPVPERKPRVEPQQQGVRRVWHKASAEQAYVTLAFKTPKLESFDNAANSNTNTQDALALTVLAAVLDGYPNARLGRALTQGPNRVADDVGAYHGLMARGPQMFFLDGVPKAGKTVQDVETALREQVAKVTREGVSEAELNRVKTQWISAEIYKLDSVFSQARELGSYWSLELPLDTGSQLIRQLRAVTADQVKAVAAKYFGDDQLTVGVLVPQPMSGKPRPRPPISGDLH